VAGARGVWGCGCCPSVAPVVATIQMTMAVRRASRAERS
jgi:hypothetical protein